jgi:hypothetical protein
MVRTGADLSASATDVNELWDGNVVLWGTMFPLATAFCTADSSGNFVILSVLSIGALSRCASDFAGLPGKAVWRMTAGAGGVL